MERVTAHPGGAACTTHMTPVGIQFLVFPKKIIVHLIISGFEIINIRLVGRWSWKLHMSPGSKGAHAKSSFAERQKAEQQH